MAEWGGHVTTVDQDPVRVREAQQHIDAATDISASATKHFTETLLQHPHVETSLIAIRDGLLVCRKHQA